MQSRSHRSAPSRRIVALLGAAIAIQLVAGVTGAIVLAPSSSQGVSTRFATSTGEVSNVQASVPVRVDISRLELSAPVDKVGREDDGTMAVPEDFDRAGWYAGLESPGQTGTAVIVGHLDSETGPAAFARVPELGAGDEIVVALADTTTVRFVVERTEQYDKDRFPTIAVYAPADRPVLRLITCGGTFDKQRRQYTDNVVVYASAQEAK